MAEKELLASIERSATEEMRVSINEYKGKEYVDMRIYYTTDDGATWNPTKKGITVAPERIDEVIAALNKAKETFEA